MTVQPLSIFYCHTPLPLPLPLLTLHPSSLLCLYTCTYASHTPFLLPTLTRSLPPPSSPPPPLPSLADLLLQSLYVGQCSLQIFPCLVQLNCLVVTGTKMQQLSHTHTYACTHTYTQWINVQSCQIESCSPPPAKTGAHALLQGALGKLKLGQVLTGVLTVPSNHTEGA